MADLVVQNLSVSYSGINAVRGLTFEVRGGQLVALVGPNGSGKSSTARAIMGLTSATGIVTIRGKHVLGLPTYKRAELGVAFVPEGRGLFAHLSVRDNILLGGYRTDARLRQKRFDYACSLFPVLAQRLQQTANSLSGGEQQMLAVARALMIEPSVLICDEPSMGLAPAVAKTLFATLRTIADHGAAVLVGDQNARLLFSVADEVSVMRLGAIVARESPKDLHDQGALARHYFGAADMKRGG